MPSLRISGMAPEYWRRATVLSTAPMTVIGCSRASRRSSVSAVSASVSHSSPRSSTTTSARRPKRSATPAMRSSSRAPSAAPWATLPQNGAWASGVGRTWTWNSGMPASAADWAIVASAVVLPLRGGPVTSTWPWSSGIPRARRSTSPMANASRSVDTGASSEARRNSSGSTPTAGRLGHAGVAQPRGQPGDLVGLALAVGRPAEHGDLDLGAVHDRPSRRAVRRQDPDRLTGVGVLVVVGQAQHEPAGQRADERHRHRRPAVGRDHEVHADLAPVGDEPGEQVEPAPGVDALVDRLEPGVAVEQHEHPGSSTRRRARCGGTRAATRPARRRSRSPAGRCARAACAAAG